jgi:transcriptional regulator with XRE-family HTH domain
MTVGQLFKQARAFEKQEYFASQLGISQSHLANIERGRSMPTMPILYRLSKLKKVSMYEVFQSVEDSLEKNVIF